MRTKLKKMRVKHKVTPLKNMILMRRPFRRIHAKPQGPSMAKAVASEICGLAPYEKKAADLIRGGQERKCKRFLKKRLGNLKRANRKLSVLAEFVRQ